MEMLKYMVPGTLQRQIKESTTDDLPSTGSSMLNFFSQLPEFQQLIGNLTDSERTLYRKNKESALDLKRSGNDFVSRGVYCKALSLYSQALRVTPVSAEDMGKNLVAMLYLNRALVLHNMDLIEECVRDCNRALAISPSYAKAWYRRGKANASLENYKDAVRDLHVAMNMEQSLSGKRKIKNELKSISDQHKETSLLNRPDESKSSGTDESDQIEIQCVSTPTKGRSMVSVGDISKASLIHREEPYAAIILKEHRETHCHFCFNGLPADTVPCSYCALPLYCSQQCQKQAGGQKTGRNSKSCEIWETLSDEIEKYIEDITLFNVSASDIHPFGEHRHECDGVHWPAVLPPDVVLAGRILVKSVEQKGHCSYVSNLRTPDLSHNYEQLSPETKLEFHVYSIALIYCLQNSYGFAFPKNGEIVAKFVTLLSQISVNSMAIVRMEYPDVYGPMYLSGKFSQAEDAITSSVEQVRVGQAIYSAGSLFNHSCQPNIHAYFLSRTLYIRCTEFVAAGCPLELSYGPQVGEGHWCSRLEFLKDKYAFICRCRSCSEINLPDLVMTAFRCVEPNCFGAVLANGTAQYVKYKIDHLLAVPPMQVSNLFYVDKLKDEEIEKVAGHVFEKNGCSDQIKPGYCLRCGSYRDLEASYATIEEPGPDIRRLEDEIFLDKVQTDTLSNVLTSLEVLRSTLHAYNKKIAQVEDILAHAFSLVGELELALDHCKASIEIIEKHYGPDHIAIGNELVKLSSIQLSLGDKSVVETLNRVDAIFSQYYGSHTNAIFPYLEGLKREACELVQ